MSVIIAQKLDFRNSFSGRNFDLCVVLMTELELPFGIIILIFFFGRSWVGLVRMKLEQCQCLGDRSAQSKKKNRG